MAFAACAALLLAGCEPAPQIRQYTVPKLAVESAASRSPQAAERSTLGAVVLTGTSAWFFKITGEPAAVSAVRGDVVTFIKAVHFSADEPPSWELPAGWKERPGDRFRHATIEIASTPPLEMSVSQLPRGEDDDDYILQNVDRWRGQLGLEPTTPEALAKEAERFTVGEFPVTVVELIGSGSGTMGGPFSGRAIGGRPLAAGELPKDHPPLATGDDAAPRRSDRNASPVKYEVPEGWVERAPDSIRVASFQVVDGEQKLEISVTPLAPTGPAADVTENVNRWRGQVGLSRQSAGEIASELRQLEGRGVTWQVVELTGESSAAGPQVLLGAIGKTETATWFVKLSGPPQLARREKEHFDQFVRTLEVK